MRLSILAVSCALLVGLGLRPVRAQILTNNGASVKTTSGAIVYVNGSVNNAGGTYDNTGTTTITGSITNGATVADSGLINVAVDWINNGTFTRYIGTVAMNGSTAQLFSGTSTTTFNNLNFLNGGTKTLNTPEIVDGQANFTSGIVYTTQTNVLTFTVNGTWINGSSTSYVDGPAAKNFNSTTEFQYPIGKASRFNTAGVKPNSATATTFRAEYFNVPYVNTTSLIAPLKNVSKVQYWNIDQISGTANAQVRLYWIAGDYQASWLPNINMLEVARWTGAAWTGEGNAFVTGNFNAGNLLSNVVTTWGLSPNEHFTLGSDTLANSLPVELDHFAAQQVGSNVRLDWLTRSEIQNEGFEIERSSGNDPSHLIQTWQTDNELKAKSKYGASYKTLDAPTADGEYTYDLYQRDLDGSRWHIASQTLLYRQTPSNGAETVELYPNPVLDHTEIHLGLVKDASNMMVELYDAAGRKVLSQEYGPMTTGFQNLQLSGLGKFSTGRYMLIINAGDRHLSQSLIIAR